LKIQETLTGKVTSLDAPKKVQRKDRPIIVIPKTPKKKAPVRKAPVKRKIPVPRDEEPVEEDFLDALLMPKKKRSVNRGTGVVDDIGNFAKNTVDAIKHGVRKGPSPKFRQMLKKYANEKIVAATVQRFPVSGIIKRISNMLTSGKFDKKAMELGYDDIYHLSMVFVMDSGKMLLFEKNEVVVLEEQA
jgi:hypothetical protein